MFKKIAFFFVLLFSLNLMPLDTLSAQCPMCRMSAEQNLKDGGKAGKGLNNGILYLFAMPYLIVGGMAFWWYKNRKKDDSAELAEEVLLDQSRLN